MQEKIKLKLKELSKHIIRSMSAVDLNNLPIKEIKKLVRKEYKELKIKH